MSLLLKEHDRRNKKTNSLYSIIRSFLNDYNEGCFSGEEEKLKKIIIALHITLLEKGIDETYSNPDLIELKLSKTEVTTQFLSER